jgi:hypothetical protein
MFSLALDQDGGYIGFGGLPPVDFKRPIVTVPSQFPKGDIPQHYSFTADALLYEGSKNISIPLVIDTGAAYNMLPSTITEKLYGLYQPKATLGDDVGRYYTDCNAKVPEFAIQIGGIAFKIPPENMIMQESRNASTGRCQTTLLPAPSGFPIYLVGLPFLQSVLSIIDIGAAEIRFAAR